jgi:hypothetical protein
MDAHFRELYAMKTEKSPPNMPKTDRESFNSPSNASFYHGFSVTLQPRNTEEGI